MGYGVTYLKGTQTNLISNSLYRQDGDELPLFEDCILLYVVCVCLDPKGNQKIHVAEFLLNLRLRTIKKTQVCAKCCFLLCVIIDG